MKSLQRILYVEDEPDIQTIARIALETVGGFTVEICGSGAEAIECVDRFAPDLILLDVMMPDMDGPATLAALRSHSGAADIPVVFITANVQTPEVEAYRALGAAGVIAKPFDPMKLAAMIREIWTRTHG
ncbi:MAG TPA: response regulator [Thioalkalivibrio sp.]|nr:response regulator [Thioalkalivibrio sp.]